MTTANVIPNIAKGQRITAHAPSQFIQIKSPLAVRGVGNISMPASTIISGAIMQYAAPKKMYK